MEEQNNLPDEQPAEVRNPLPQPPRNPFPIPPPPPRRRQRRVPRPPPLTGNELPYFLLLVAVVDIVCVGYCAYKKTKDHGGILNTPVVLPEREYSRPVLHEFMEVFTGTRLLFQMMSAVFLVYGIITTDVTKRSNLLSLWMKIAYFVLAEQAVSSTIMVIRLFIEDMNKSEKQSNVVYLIVNLLDAFLRTLAFALMTWSVRPKYFSRQNNREGPA